MSHDDHDHDHEHSHDHHTPHAAIPETTNSPLEKLEPVIRELLIEKGIITNEEIRQVLDVIDSRTPMQGARIVARAWVDLEYKKRLLADGDAGAKEMGVTIDNTSIVVVENTPKVHNIVVCTLCSCYPRNVLGLPPEWYKNEWYRKRVVREPRAVLREFGTILPDNVSIHVHDSNAVTRYLVLPLRPAGTENFSEEQLAALVTRDCMIGVAVVQKRD